MIFVAIVILLLVFGGGGYGLYRTGGPGYQYGYAGGIGGILVTLLFLWLIFHFLLFVI